MDPEKIVIHAQMGALDGLIKYGAADISAAAAKANKKLAQRLADLIRDRAEDGADAVRRLAVRPTEVAA